MTVTDTHRIVIAVLTYQRPDDLAELLPELLTQAEESDENVRILVVDNDPAGSAASVCAPFAEQGVSYVLETTPGISAARNRALEEAGDDNLLVYIDDDERPAPQWLHHLVALYRAETPAGVVGPVVSRFAHEPDEFITAGRFFERRRLPTGTPVDVAATNNLLLDLRQTQGLRFDADFGISGGSDTLFTRQLSQSGRRLLWCDEALVYDIVPPSRLTRGWVLNRAYRSGNSWSRTSIRLARTPVDRVTTRLHLTVQGVARLASGAVLRVAGAPTRLRHLEARGLRRLSRGGGMLAGAWGHVYSEYRRS
ncbi:glycosyltransferase family 2 protein [Salinibacterium sp. SYSU T00001]|uniref:glycosyltransferase family 2 protein n=1 Tax=Homoserinimonas sedimenticola TaxID=2986805 RepID=UPI0022367C4D|nr:glycosyltransferase family 2 protein [Salinibacterium sedimenticola]MCW4385444.1 glycosyltransferase family 2 protein [Salinibacterium sedimenticola]